MRDQRAADNVGFDEDAGCSPADFTLNTLALSRQERQVLCKIQAQDMTEITAERLLRITPKTRIHGIGSVAMEQVFSIQRRVREVLLEFSRHPEAQLYADGLLVGPVLRRCMRGNVLNLALLTRQEQQLLVKLERLYGDRPTVYRIMCTAPEAGHKGIGRKSITALAALQHRLWPEITACVGRVPDATSAPKVPAFAGVPARTLFVPTHRFQPLSAEVIAFITVDDFSVLLSAVDERPREISLARWGLRGPRQRLCDLAARYGVSRERIRQIARDIDVLIPGVMRVHPAVLWASVERYLNTGFEELLDLLQRRFSSPQLVAAFLERCCDVADGSIGDVVLTERVPAPGAYSYFSPATSKAVEIVAGCVLDEIFATTLQPVAEERVITALMSRHGWSALQAVHVLGRLIDDGVVSRTDRGVLLPGRLSKQAAVAHALLPYPQGLRLRDIVRLVNSYSLCRHEFSAERPSDAVYRNIWTYLCSPGTYRHVRYLLISPDEISETLDAVRDFLRSSRYDDASLRSVYLAIGAGLSLDYYDLRYVVSTLGQERDLFFCGRSMSDTVSLHPGLSLVGLSEAIYRLLEGSGRLLNREDIAGMLRSSAGSVTAALRPLYKSGRITRVSVGLYAVTPASGD